MADLTRLAGKGFLVIGRAGMDLYADPAGTALEHATQFSAALGGSSANIAAGLCRLGCDAALVTCVSDDPVGTFCLTQMAAYGIDRRYVRRTAGGARTSLAVVDTCGADTQAVIYRNGAADFDMTAADVANLPYRGFSALVATGTALASNPSRQATLDALARGRAAGLPLILDIDYRPYSWASGQEAARVCAQAAALCDMVVGNDDEFGLLAGDHARGLQAARDLARGGALVIYKMGARGAITLSGDSETHTGVFRTQALKPTGAGDAFLAAVLAALADGHPVDRAVRRGSAAAAIVVSRVGCAPAMPTAHDLDRFIAGADAPAA